MMTGGNGGKKENQRTDRVGGTCQNGSTHIKGSVKGRFSGGGGAKEHNAHQKSTCYGRGLGGRKRCGLVGGGKGSEFRKAKGVARGGTFSFLRWKKKGPSCRKKNTGTTGAKSLPQKKLEERERRGTDSTQQKSLKVPSLAGDWA